MEFVSPSELIWRAAGSPLPKWPMEPARLGVCATCGAPIREGVSHEAINSESFAGHADYLAFGTHVCPACAWLYGLGRSKPGNVLAVGGALYHPMLSRESARKEGRPTWLEALEEASQAPPDTPVTGVMTVDPKPRLWPRARVGSRGGVFYLYVHNPDWDVSQLVGFDLDRALELVPRLQKVLALGFSKRSVFWDLLRDHKRARKDLRGALALERELARLRPEPEFVVALMAAGGEE